MHENWAGRRCGRCSLCCKLLDASLLAKPAGVWCERCDPGRGCTVYPDRPDICRNFACCWLADPSLGDEWYPAQCHMVLSVDAARLAVYVDPARADAWRRKPHHAMLRAIAKRPAPEVHQVVVAIGPRRFVVLPDRDLDAGIVGEGESVSCVPEITASGVEWRVERTKP